MVRSVRIDDYDFWMRLRREGGQIVFCLVCWAVMIGYTFLTILVMGPEALSFWLVVEDSEDSLDDMDMRIQRNTDVLACGLFVMGM